jgi:hypothetical protein
LVPTKHSTKLPTFSQLEIELREQLKSRHHFVPCLLTGENDCWIWLGPRHIDNYGLVGKQLAHRYVAQLYVPLPQLNFGRMIVRHKCRVKPCVNPAHLEWLTTIEHNCIMYAETPNKTYDYLSEHIAWLRENFERGNM